MANLYSLIETGAKEKDNHKIEKVELLFDLQGDTYSISDTEYKKHVVCTCGSCSLNISSNEIKDFISLNRPNMTVVIDKNAQLEFRDYTKETKIVIEYLGEK
ncbi:MAG: hypothetical protein ACI4S3_08835 [Candidatus Gastranaerophilaceae bacterium]